MTGPTSTRWRLARSAVFALVTGYLAGLGHLAGGGGFPDVGPLLLASALSGLVVTGLVGRRRTFGQLFGLMLGTQLALHLLFAIAGHHAALDYPRMLAFHAVAAVGAAAVLARADRALFGLFGALGRVVRRLVPAGPVATRPTWTVLGLEGVRPPPATPFLEDRPRRGPPSAI